MESVKLKYMKTDVVLSPQGIGKSTTMGRTGNVEFCFIC